MILNRGSQRAIIAISFSVLAVIYAIAWMAPATGLSYDDGIYAVTAKALAAGHGYVIDSLPRPVPETKFPPFFPAVLALFTLVSQQTLWLKLLPMLCSVGWLALTYKLLRKTGATSNGALVLILLTAVSPMVVFLSTSLLSDSLFALLLMAALLMLLEDRAFLAGALAGLATLTRSAGVPLIAACILTLVIRRRFRSATIFTLVSMLMVAPWFGWSLANASHGLARGGESYLSSNILTSLPANEKVLVLARNLVLVAESPGALLTGYHDLYSAIGLVLALGWCLYVRRHLLPDLFVGLYCLMLLCVAWPPERFVAPIFPLILWMFWRVVSRARIQEAVAAGVLILAAAGLWADGMRVSKMRADGTVFSGTEAPDNWGEMQKLFGFIRENTTQQSVLLGDLDPVLYLNTGRKAVRGFRADGFGLYYAMKEAGVTPDEISSAILRDQVDYVVLTPDRGFAESPSFHASVQALERGGVLQPVPIPGISPEYRLLKVH
ncbi:MAG TPA: glycosyltransferase family 39 protein [Bryobacteraceae bacterium]|jgi:hypothetical protein|nr:glycosyltransferase family 39 protein [Bryobacteraceae bacterium]